MKYHIYNPLKESRKGKLILRSSESESRDHTVSRLARIRNLDLGNGDKSTVGITWVVNMVPFPQEMMAENPVAYQD